MMHNIIIIIIIIVVVVVIIVFVFVFVLIAKYASLSDGEYKKLMSCTYEDLIDEFQHQLQLVTGWLGLHLNFIDYEIMASCE